MLQDKRDYNFNSVGTDLGDAYDAGYKQGSQETAKDILNGLECFFWETAINDTKYFDLYEGLYRDIKDIFKNKYGVTKEN